VADVVDTSKIDISGGGSPDGVVARGTLYLVATPLGNLKDMSPRAKEMLDCVDYIAAEDTRRAARLLSSLGVGNRLISYFEQNMHRRHDMLIHDLLEGKSIAVISDAGMPCISDPGEELVRLAIENEITISVIPGPSALVSAIAVSGFDTTRFVFEGFLPVKGKARKIRLQALATEQRTLVFYEAPHRIRRTLADLATGGMESRRLVIARELTKPYEELLYFTVVEANRYYETMNPKGEFTIAVEGLDEYHSRTGEPLESGYTDQALRQLLDQRQSTGLGPSSAASAVAKETGVDRNKLYQLTLELRDDMVKQEENSGQ
jgi:16S rRNA (cytidine1402-2'-O)-methyltransferase